jgi:hypothetical protein
MALIEKPPVGRNSGRISRPRFECVVIRSYQAGREAAGAAKASPFAR